MIDSTTNHQFEPWIFDDYICVKCGETAMSIPEVQLYLETPDCIDDDDPRCVDISAALNEQRKLHHQQHAETESVEEAIPIYTPSSLAELKQFLDWLNSKDPVKALWGIK